MNLASQTPKALFSNGDYAGSLISTLKSNNHTVFVWPSSGRYGLFKSKNIVFHLSLSSDFSYFPPNHSVPVINQNTKKCLLIVIVAINMYCFPKISRCSNKCIHNLRSKTSHLTCLRPLSSSAVPIFQRLHLMQFN